MLLSHQQAEARAGERVREVVRADLDDGCELFADSVKSVVALPSTGWPSTASTRERFDGSSAASRFLSRSRDNGPRVYSDVCMQVGGQAAGGALRPKS